MLKVFTKYIAVIIAALAIFSFYFAPRSVVAYNTKNLTAVSQKVQKDILKIPEQK